MVSVYGQVSIAFTRGEVIGSMISILSCVQSLLGVFTLLGYGKWGSFTCVQTSITIWHPQRGSVWWWRHWDIIWYCTEQGDCQFGWDLLGYYKMDRTFYCRLRVLFAIRVSFCRETGMAERRWRESRMCNPFCNNPPYPIQTDSHLGTERVFTTTTNSLNEYSSLGVFSIIWMLIFRWFFWSFKIPHTNWCLYFLVPCYPVSSQHASYPTSDISEKQINLTLIHLYATHIIRDRYTYHNASRNVSINSRYASMLGRLDVEREKSIRKGFTIIPSWGKGLIFY